MITPRPYDDSSVIRPSLQWAVRRLTPQGAVDGSAKESVKLDLVAKVRDAIDRHGLLAEGDTVVVGVSGGPDSLCLLHVLKRLCPDYGISLHVAHLNHSIRGHEAEVDALYVAKIAAQWDIPCTVRAVDVPDLAERAGLALEEGARRARYGFLAYVRRRVGGETVAVGHHADDQVETVLMHFLRGAGLSGLRGMAPLSYIDGLDTTLGEAEDDEPPKAVDSRLRLIRPLLSVSRSEIENYCRAHNLEPRHDATNLDTTYLRNRIRHELIPLLQTYNRNIRQIVQRTSRLVSDDQDVLRAVIAAAWPAVLLTQQPEAVSLDRVALSAHLVGMRRALIREGIRQVRGSLTDIGWVHVDNAVALLEGAVGASIDLPGDLRIVLDYDRLTIATSSYRRQFEPWPHVRGEIALRVPGSVLMANGWTVTACTVLVQDLPIDWRHNADRYRAYLDARNISDALILRSRRDGDSFVPLGMDHHQKLHDFMVNNKIPRSERDMVPLLTVGTQICWVVGWRIDSRFAVTDDTESVLLVTFTRL